MIQSISYAKTATVYVLVFVQFCVQGAPKK